MKKIGVTIEVTQRRFKEFDISDAAYSAMIENYKLIDGIGTEAYQTFLDELSFGDDCEIDYAVTDEDGATIIDWDE